MSSHQLGPGSFLSQQFLVSNRETVFLLVAGSSSGQKLEHMRCGQGLKGISETKELLLKYAEGSCSKGGTWHHMVRRFHRCQQTKSVTKDSFMPQRMYVLALSSETFWNFIISTKAIFSQIFFHIWLKSTQQEQIPYMIKRFF